MPFLELEAFKPEVVEGINHADGGISLVGDQVGHVAFQVFANLDVPATPGQPATGEVQLRFIDANGNPVAVAGQSATGSADESVTLSSPTKGSYRVVIDGFAAAQGESSIAYRYDDFVLPSTGGVGSLTASPNPVPVTQGESTQFTASWSGLDAVHRAILGFQA